MNRQTHPLVEVLETDDWLLLDCPMCAGQLVRVWHSTGRLDRLGESVVEHGVAHWWARDGVPDRRRA